MTNTVVIGTKHGIYPVHRHWLEAPEACIDRWVKAGSLKAPNTLLYVLDLRGVRHLPAGITSDLAA